MDFIIFLQAFLYFFIFVAGFFVCIPVGVNRYKFSGICILYSDVQKWYTLGFTNHSACEFPMYFGMFGMIILGLIAGLSFGYIAFKSRKNKDIGYRLWSLLFIPLNAALAIVSLVSACVLTVGFKTFCDSMEEAFTLRCADYEDGWLKGKTDLGPFVSLSKLSQAGAWIGFFLFLVQTGISVLRHLRNRRLKESKMKKKAVAGRDLTLL